MKRVKGYNFSRPFMGERVPQHVQNIVIKDYCQKKLQEAKMKIETIQSSDNVDVIPEKLSSIKPD